MKTFLYALRGEWLKMKNSFALWLGLAAILVIGFILFMAHYLDINTVTVIGRNPWPRIINVSLAMMGAFILNALIILLVAANLFIENKAKAWKLIYAFPLPRAFPYFSKVVMILFVLVLIFLGLMLAVGICAFILNILLPEIEFYYYSIDWGLWVSDTLHLLISSLGVLGIQYFLSVRFRNFLVPVGIGTIGFVAGLVLGSFNTPRALYLPYTYPMIVKDHNMFPIDQVGVVQYGWFSNVELLSIGVGFSFIMLGYFLERNREILD